MTEIQQKAWNKTNGGNVGVTGNGVVDNVEEGGITTPVKGRLELTIQVDGVNRAVLLVANSQRDMISSLRKGEKVHFFGEVHSMKNWGFWISAYVIPYELGTGSGEKDVQGEPSERNDAALRDLGVGSTWEYEVVNVTRGKPSKIGHLTMSVTSRDEKGVTITTTSDNPTDLPAPDEAFNQFAPDPNAPASVKGDIEVVDTALGRFKCAKFTMNINDDTINKIEKWRTTALPVFAKSMSHASKLNSANVWTLTKLTVVPPKEAKGRQTKQNTLPIESAEAVDMLNLLQSYSKLSSEEREKWNAARKGKVIRVKGDGKFVVFHERFSSANLDLAEGLNVHLHLKKSHFEKAKALTKGERVSFSGVLREGDGGSSERYAYLDVVVDDF